MKESAIIIFVFVLISFSSRSQNLIPNGDFEEYEQIPTGRAQWYNCKDWSSVNDLQIFEGNGTPDYYHTQAEVAVNLPNSLSAYISPKSGEAIMGFVAMYDPIVYSYSIVRDFREYLACELESNLVIGDMYEVSFWISNGDSLHESGYKTDGVGVCFSTKPLIQSWHEVIEVVPQLQIQEALWTTEWKKISFNFLADSSYRYFTLGNFYDLYEINTTFMVGASVASAYYFIDKVEVERIRIEYDTICYGESIKLIAPSDSLYSWSRKNYPNIEISSDSIIEVSPLKTTSYIYEGTYNVFERYIVVEGCSEIEMPNVFTPNNDQINDYFIPIYSKNIGYSKLTVINRWGAPVFQTNDLNAGWNGESQEGICSDGVYFWKLSYQDLLGEQFEIIGNVTLVR